MSIGQAKREGRRTTHGADSRVCQHLGIDVHPILLFMSFSAFPSYTTLSSDFSALLCSNEPPNEAQKSEMRRLVAQQSRFLQEIEAEIRRLQALRDDALIEHGACQGVASPMRELPIELLTQIFEEACMKPQYGQKSSSPSTLAHVSRRWRSVCLGAPRLWRSITAGSRHLKSDASCENYLSTIMARAGAYCVDLEIQDRKNPKLADSELTIDPNSKNAAKLRSLSLRLNEDVMAQFSSSLPIPSFPNLVELDLSSHYKKIYLIDTPFDQLA